MHNTLGGSIIIISHQERILNIADRIVVLGNGELRATGTKDEILPEILGTVDSGCKILADNVRGAH